jgi:hypothetical protein
MKMAPEMLNKTAGIVLGVTLARLAVIETSVADTRQISWWSQCCRNRDPTPVTMSWKRHSPASARKGNMRVCSFQIASNGRPVFLSPGSAISHAGHTADNNPANTHWKLLRYFDGLGKCHRQIFASGVECRQGFQRATTKCWVNPSALHKFSETSGRI